MSKIKFNLTPQDHIKEIKECGEKFTGSQYYCLYKEDIEKLVKYSEKRDKEIERLNNIINELEKRIVMKTNSDFIDTKVKDVCCELYQILQELKVGSSNEN